MLAILKLVQSLIKELHSDGTPLQIGLGAALGAALGLTPMWTTWFNAPLVPYTNFNNTIVLGSVVAWLVLATPIWFATRFAVVRYRATYGERVRRSRFYRAVTASQAYNVYRWFRPE